MVMTSLLPEGIGIGRSTSSLPFGYNDRHTSMRHTIAIVIVLTLIACSPDATPAREPLALESIERTYETNVAASTPYRPAKRDVFVIVHLTEDPARKEYRDWIRSTVEDWDGRTYNAKYAGVNRSESESAGLFGPRTIKHPDRIQVVFEVPEVSTLRSMTVPHPISLFQAPVRISDLRLAPKIIRRVDPYYPADTRRRGIEGLVKLEVLVMPDGTVAGARLIDGEPLLGEAAAAAVRQWTYKPALVDGKAVPALINVQVDFQATPSKLDAFSDRGTDSRVER